VKPVDTRRNKGLGRFGQFLDFLRFVRYLARFEIISAIFGVAFF